VRRFWLTAAVCVVGCPLFAAPAHGRVVDKAIWGPTVINRNNGACPTADRCSAFPIYRELGVDFYEFQLFFTDIAPTQPANPRDPADPAYKWPSAVDVAVNDAVANGIGLTALVQFSPPWANGGRTRDWSPDKRFFADFLYAASKRYPSITRWIIWGEPQLGSNYQPMSAGSRVGPRTYGKLVDASYVALKQASRRNVVIGGGTLSTGVVPIRQYIRFMRLKNGRMPRMDLWCHNPFDVRFPRLKDKPLAPGFRGLNDIDTLEADLRRAYLGKGGKKKGAKSARKRKPQKPPKLWLSEWTVVSDHPTNVFGNSFFVSREEQAQRISAAYAMVSRLKYVQGLGYFTLLDQPETNPDNAHWGLMQADGFRKPSFGAYAAVP
jgi:hypothetical protein